MNTGQTNIVRILDRQIQDGDENTVRVFKQKKKGLVLSVIPDFGTVVIGLKKLNPEFQQEFEELIAGSSNIVFLDESKQSWAHSVAAIGAFSSVGQARKNGHKANVPSGISHKQIKVEKVRGELMVFNIPGSPWSL